MKLVLGCIDGQGQVIDAQSVAVGIRVGESPGLQDLVIGQVDSCKKIAINHNISRRPSKYGTRDRGRSKKKRHICISSRRCSRAIKGTYLELWSTKKVFMSSADDIARNKTQTWNNRAGAEGNLFRLIVEVADGCINHHAAHWLPGKLILRPVLQAS